jgi:Uncharacterized conserved protein
MAIRTAASPGGRHAKGCEVNQKEKIMSNYRKKFVVKPGSKIRLKHFDPATMANMNHASQLCPKLRRTARKWTNCNILCMRSTSVRSSLCCRDSMLVAKTAQSATSYWNESSGLRFCWFKQPTPKELAHDFLWRVHPHVPAKGSVVIFNRSHYEDVLVARVHDLVPEKIWSKRYDEINDFEKLITTQNNTTILKFFLHISKEEQLARFEKRLDDPARQWKISESDYKEREYWDDYIKAFEDVLNKTSTEHAPGSSFLQTTNGFGTWLFHKLLSGRWKTWTCNFPRQP